MPVPSSSTFYYPSVRPEGVGCLLSGSAGPPRRTITVCGTELVVWPRTMNLCGGRLQGRVKIGSISRLNEGASVLQYLKLSGVVSVMFRVFTWLTSIREFPS